MSVVKAGLMKISSSLEDSSFVVVFIHGIGGDPYNTWRKNPQTKTMIELLGNDPDLKDAEFYSYGYRTGIKPLQYDFKKVAKLLHSDIQANLAGKDLLFVAHSMGGLVVQQYIVDRYESYESADLKCVKGVVYLSVPFYGSGWAELLPKKMVNRQIRSLRRKNKDLVQLEENWNKYVYRGGIDKLVDSLKHEISQISFYGVRDQVVVESSSTPLYLGSEVNYVDEDHKSICKIDDKTTVYKLIRSFLIKLIVPQSIKRDYMILHVHGFDKQQLPENAHFELDWTEYFDANTSPRRLPSSEEWGVMSKELNEAAKYWSQKKVTAESSIRVYAKLNLPGGVLIGNRFSRTRGVHIEVAQYEQIWSSTELDSNFKVAKITHSGNEITNKRAVMVLSVTRDIKNDIQAFLNDCSVNYSQLINLSPDSGAGRDSIVGAGQAVAFAAEVKVAADELKQSGIETIDLYLNCPIGVAILVGHYLTAVSPIRIFDYANPGYVVACSI
ncbi:alpha/beta fold hydrolase [Paenibacillus sp. PAMC 26794]|uniref:alpha/beta fold hydrolase n=1 Tax=Paenibacillus sp. PAMC 26794 TaxID=1257080 RepID=UPI0002D729F3|nr:alpha/beta fold hydrolase [Paenibacillus sp. PAMC 26794]